VPSLPDSKLSLRAQPGRYTHFERAALLLESCKRFIVEQRLVHEDPFRSGLVEDRRAISPCFIVKRTP